MALWRAPAPKPCPECGQGARAPYIRLWQVRGIKAQYRGQVICPQCGRRGPTASTAGTSERDRRECMEGACRAWAACK